MEIRKAALQDLDRVAGLFTEATCDLNRRGIHMWDELYPDRACLGEDINHQSLYLMEDGGELAAAFVLEEVIDFTVPVDWQYDGRSAWICRLCVSAARQNRGYGRRAMLEAERLLREQGYEAARLDAFWNHPASLHLYESLGYRRVGEAVFRKGLFYFYEKALIDSDARG